MALGGAEYVAFAPDQAKYLYPRDGFERNKSRVVDIENPDLDAFPLFASATPVRTLLRAGETLFMPSGWWHTARILEPTITVSRDGPYRVTGGINLIGADPRAEGASTEHYALCRCGGSKNKPFCDGTHWYNHFADPTN